MGIEQQRDRNGIETGLDSLRAPDSNLREQGKAEIVSDYIKRIDDILDLQKDNFVHNYQTVKTAVAELIKNISNMYEDKEQANEALNKLLGKAAKSPEKILRALIPHKSKTFESFLNSDDRASYLEGKLSFFKDIESFIARREAGQISNIDDELDKLHQQHPNAKWNEYDKSLRNETDSSKLNLDGIGKIIQRLEYMKLAPSIAKEAALLVDHVGDYSTLLRIVERELKYPSEDCCFYGEGSMFQISNNDIDPVVITPKEDGAIIIKRGHPSRSFHYFALERTADGNGFSIDITNDSRTADMPYDTKIVYENGEFTKLQPPFQYGDVPVEAVKMLEDVSRDLATLESKRELFTPQVWNEVSK